MTFCAALWNDQTVAIVGDLLLTNGGLPIRTRIPSSPDLDTKKAGQGYVAGLLQKLLIIDNRILFAFSGSVNEARKVARLITFASKRKDISVSTISDAINRDSTIDFSKIEYMVCLIEGEMIRVILKNTTEYDFAPFTKVVTVGSGTQNFIEELSKVASYQQKVSTRELLEVSNSFMAKSVALQAYGEYGLDLGWGGGFEFAYKTANGFTKLDRRLQRTFIINVNENKSVDELIQPYCWSASWYEDDTLNVSRMFNGTGHLFTIGSLLHNRSDTITPLVFNPNAINDVALYHHTHDGKTLIIGACTNFQFSPEIICMTGETKIKDKVCICTSGEDMTPDDEHIREFIEWALRQKDKLTFRF